MQKSERMVDEMMQQVHTRHTSHTESSAGSSLTARPCGDVGDGGGRAEWLGAVCQGAETVNQLHQQKDRLKGAQRKLMDVMNTLGLSNSLMGGTHAHLPCSVDTRVSTASVVRCLPSAVLLLLFDRCRFPVCMFQTIR